MEWDPAVYKTLLESTRAIPWKIDWATMRFAYIGPQIEPLLGWERDSWISVEDWATRIHPDDRDHVVNYCVSQSKAGVDHEADYRALTRVHGVRDAQGEVESLVGFMFDISERKKWEQELIALQRELETLSFEDGLTGISNRRLFDSRLEIEWAQGEQSGRMLSLILADIDLFKYYNDFYGHIEGDDCLKRIALALKQVASRPGAIVARFGGEEFVLLLPETSQAEALAIVDAARKLIAEANISHETSDVSEIVTASFGVGSVVPSAQKDPKAFVQAVDALLYSAKQKGRDRIEAGLF